MKIELTGYNIDNLLKTLHKKNFQIKNINRTEYDKVSFEIKEQDEKRIKKYIANYKTKKQEKKIKRIKKFVIINLDAILGSFFGIIICLFLSNFTWNIKIFGTKDLDQFEIIQVLKQNGISTKKINTANNKQIEEILLNKYDRIAQVSVMKMGTSILINLSEKLVYSDKKFEPIVAKFNGIVENINLVSGTLNCKVGDYVNVGDQLVLPFVLNGNGNKVNVEPIGEITGKIFIVGKAEITKTEAILVRTGNKKICYNYKFSNYNLFSGMGKNSFALFETKVYNENVSDLIPFWRERVEFYELETQIKGNDFESNKQSLLDASYNKAKSQLGELIVVDESKTLQIVGDKMIATTILTTQGLIND